MELANCVGKATMAGVDMDMVGESILFPPNTKRRENIGSNDAASQGNLEAKYKLGLFDDPYRYCDENRAKTEIFTDAHRKEARSIAAQSFVLLKNQDNILPLKKSGTIALVGPLADNKENMPGTWSVAANFSKASSVLTGIKKVVGDRAKIIYAKGSNLDADEKFEERAGMFGKALGRDNRPAGDIIAEAVNAANQSDVVVAVVGESAEMTGESSSRSNTEIPEVQRCQGFIENQ